MLTNVAIRKNGRIFAATSHCLNGDPANKVDKVDDFMSEMVETELLEGPQEEVVSEAVAEEPEHNRSKTFDNETVQKIVARERKKAAEKAKREILMQLQQEQMQQPEAQGQAQAPVNGQAPSSLGGMPQMSQEDIQRLISQQLPQHLANYISEETQNRQIEGFVNKMRAAEEKYPGLEEKLNNYDYSPGSGMTEIVMAANNLENTADIIKEITDHPQKLANLITLVKQPYALNQALQSLSASIKTNQDALAKEQQSQDPLNRLRPSANTGLDNGNMSVSDFRKMFTG